MSRVFFAVTHNITTADTKDLTVEEIEEVFVFAHHLQEQERKTFPGRYHPYPLSHSSGISVYSRGH